MKNVMDFPLLGLLNFVGFIFYRIYYLKSFEELSLKFPIPFCLDVFAIQPNFVARGVALGLHSLVVGLFLKLLSMVDVLPIDSHQFLEFY